MKRCPTCDRTRPEAAFNRNRSNPDGLQNRCRECRSEETARPVGEAPRRATGALVLGRTKPGRIRPPGSVVGTWEPGPGLGAALERLRARDG